MTNDECREPQTDVATSSSSYASFPSNCNAMQAVQHLSFYSVYIMGLFLYHTISDSTVA